MAPIRILIAVAGLVSQPAILPTSVEASSAALSTPVPITFRLDGPALVVRRVSVFDARGDLTVPSVTGTPSRSDAIVVAFEPGQDVVVQFELEGGAYLLDGPFRWPSQPLTRDLPHALKRTISGTLPSQSMLDRPVWIGANGRATADPWPRCGASGGTWACVGVPVGESGLAVFADRPALFAQVPAGGAPVMQAAAWATVVVTRRDFDDNPAAIKLQLWRANDLPRSTSSTRIMPNPETRCRVLPLGADAFIVSCSVDDDVEVQVQAAGAATLRTTLDAAGASLLSAVQMDLAPEVVVVGRVETSQGRPAPGARIEISELVAVTDEQGKPRTVRRSIADAEADKDGGFDVKGLGPGRYEALAVHPQLGRGRVGFEPGSRPVLVRLAPTTRVVGRVVRRGVPVAGAKVDALPSHADYLKAADPFDVVALETTTGADGRFELSLAPGGAADVRIVHDNVTVRRTVSGATAALIDLADIEWPSSVVVTLEYAGDERCSLVAAGPLGRSGMTIAEASIVAAGIRRLVLPEAGRWVVVARCSGGELPLQPGVIEVPDDVGEWRAHVALAP